MGSLVDPSYELLDPNPDIYALFVQFDARFFYATLGRCEVQWSPRMTTCAGICSYNTGNGQCVIRLSTPLLKLRPRKDLVETLLHEMIHAYLFVTVRDRDRDGHGAKFQEHMRRINGAAGTSITIYHTFHREVAEYKTHHWRCDGSCRDRRPFFGWVKRASNRAPSKNDLWWADHQRSCGGTFIKVAEPKEYTEKREKAEKKKEDAAKGGVAKKVGGVKAEAPAKQPRIDEVFGGGGAKLGGPSSGTSRLLDTMSNGGCSKTGGGGSTQLGGSATGRSRLLDLFESKEKENRQKKMREAEDEDIQILSPPPPVQWRGLKGGNPDWQEEEEAKKNPHDAAVARCEEQMEMLQARICDLDGEDGLAAQQEYLALDERLNDARSRQVAWAMDKEEKEEEKKGGGGRVDNVTRRKGRRKRAGSYDSEPEDKTEKDDPDFQPTKGRQRAKKKPTQGAAPRAAKKGKKAAESPRKKREVVEVETIDNDDADDNEGVQQARNDADESSMFDGCHQPRPLVTAPKIDEADMEEVVLMRRIPATYQNMSIFEYLRLPPGSSPGSARYEVVGISRRAKPKRFDENETD